MCGCGVREALPRRASRGSREKCRLVQKSAATPFPQVFIGGEHVGGLATGPGIATLDEDGELDALLESAGATQSAGGTGGGKLFGIF